MNIRLDGAQDQLNSNPDQLRLEVASNAAKSKMNQSRMDMSRMSAAYSVYEGQGDANAVNNPPKISFERAFANTTKEYIKDNKSKTMVSTRDAYKHENGYPTNETADDLQKRTLEWEKKRIDKIESNKTEKKEDGIEECTFEPQLVTKSINGQTRSIKTFHKTQQAFLDRKEQKTQDLKKEMTKSQIQTNVISTQSKKIVDQKLTDRQQQPTYERLYSLNQERQVNHQASVQAADNQAVEASRMVQNTSYTDPERRGAPVHVALNSLAANKQARIDQMRRQIAIEEKEKIRNGEYKNAKSQKIAGNRIKNELDQVLQKIELTEESKLSFKQTGTILTQLGFLPTKMVKGTESEEYRLFTDLWSFMQGEEQEGITRETIEYCALCMVGNFNTNLEVEPEADEGEIVEPPTDLNSYASYNDDGVFILRRGGQRKIFNHFNVLFANRLSLYQSNKQVKDVDSERMKEAPEVNQKSQKHAQAYRQKKLGDAAATTDFVQQVYAKDKVIKEQNEAKAQKIKQDREENNTHWPQTNDYKFTKERETTGDRNVDLYMKVEKGSIAAKVVKTKDEVEIEREPEQFTMHPTINQDGAHLVNVDKVNMAEIYGVDQKLNQLEEGRKLKEIRKQGTERGIPVSKKRPPTVQHEEIKYVRTKTNKYQSDFGEVTVTAPIQTKKSISKSNNMKRKPTSFFDPYATMERSAKREKEEVQADQEDEEVNNEEAAAENQDLQKHEEVENTDAADQQEQPKEESVHEIQDLTMDEADKTPKHESEVKQEDIHIQDEQQPKNETETENQNEDAEKNMETIPEAKSHHESSNINIVNNSVPQQAENDEQQISPVKTSTSNDEEIPYQQQPDDDRDPKLYVDVNVANYGLQRIIVYEGDTVETLVADFCKRCPIDEFMIEKLKLLLQQQIDGVLERIDEDQEGHDEDEEDGHDASPKQLNLDDSRNKE